MSGSRMGAWLAAMALGLGLAAGGASAAERTTRDLRVATYNQYLGADLTPLLVAPSDRFNAALLAVLGQVADNRFRARAVRQAALIAGEDPDLVGLQEVWRYRCRDLPPVAGACASPAIAGAFVDQLPATLAALRARGADYEVAAVVRNFDTADIAVPVGGGELRGLPFAIDGKNGLLLAEDRDVILARRGLATTPVAFTGCRKSLDGCLYDNTLTIPIAAFPGLTVEYKRGFVAVDTTVRGRRYRFVNTHLEVEEPEPGNPLSMIVQSAQAGQLISTLAALPLDGRKLVLVGDLNSSPKDVAPAPGIVPPYQLFAANGYTDTWFAFLGLAPGYTCCQAADLRNAPSTLAKRIDYVLTGSGPVLVTGTRRIGEELADRTPPRDGRPRLWPSDHAGVTAVLRF